MIPGSKPYRRKKSEEHTDSAPAISQNSNENHSASNSEESFQISRSDDLKNEFNSSRRALFASIIPSAGNGLVKLLRASNNLRHEIGEKFQKVEK